MMNDLVRDLYDAGRRNLTKAAMALPALAYAVGCGDNKCLPTDPTCNPRPNHKPVASASISPDKIYIDTQGNARIEVGYSDADGDPENISKRIVGWKKNSTELTQYRGQMSVPISEVDLVAADKLIGYLVVHDWKEYSDTAFASKEVLPIPWVTVDGRFVYYLDSTAVANQVVRLKHGPIDTAAIDTTDANGRFSFRFDARNVRNPGAKSEIFAYGDATPLGGGKYHDYLDTLQIAADRDTNLGTLIMINRYVSPGGRVALPRWKFMTGNDGTGANTLKECWQNYTVSYFPNANDILSGSWPDTIKQVVDSANPRLGNRIVRSDTALQRGINIDYVIDTKGNRYEVLEWEGTVPKSIKVTLQSNKVNIISAWHELIGHSVSCLWDEDWDIPNEKLNDESIMGSANEVTELNWNYFRYSTYIPFRYDVKRHLDSSIHTIGSGATVVNLSQTATASSVPYTTYTITVSPEVREAIKSRQ